LTAVVNGLGGEDVEKDLDRILIPREKIQERVRNIAAELNEIYPEGELTIVCVLTGAIVFVADLIRYIPVKMRIGVIMVSSYVGETTTPGQTKVKLPVNKEHVEGRHVLVVDDILDSGGTIMKVADVLRKLNPASIRTCVLLRKTRPEAMKCPVDIVGFDVPDEWLVGYGLDYNNYYRNLPDVAVLAPHALKKHD
jgi:hypoxanthine phosphoribosyltransferase